MKKLLRIKQECLRDYLKGGQTKADKDKIRALAVDDVFRIVEFKIKHHHFEPAKATVKLDRKLNGSQEYFAIEDSQQRLVFIGILIFDNLKNEYFFEGRDFIHPPKSSRFKFFAKTKLLKRYPMFYSAMDLLTFDPCEEHKKIFNLEEHLRKKTSVKSLKIQKCCQNTNKYNLVVKLSWKSFEKVRDVDLSSRIFTNSGFLETLTPKSLVKKWPSRNLVHNNIEVVESSISVSRVEKIQKSNGNMVDNSFLTGKLCVNAVVPHYCNETWLINVNNANSNDRTEELYINWSNYLTPVPLWETNQSYDVNEYALVPSDERYLLARCKQRHESSETNLTTEYWYIFDDEYDVFENNSCYHSKVGQRVLQSLIGYIALNQVLYLEESRLRFVCNMDVLNGLDLGCLIQYNKNTYIVVSYVKLYAFNKDTVEVWCANYTPLSSMKNINIKEENAIISYDLGDDSNLRVRVNNPADLQKSDGRMKSTQILIDIVPRNISTEIKISVN